MEKYTKWADKTSGVNPFLPRIVTLPQRLLPKGAILLLGSLLAIVRITLLGAIAVLLLVSLLLAQPAALLMLAAACGFTGWTAGGALCAGSACAAWSLPALGRLLRGALVAPWFRLAFLVLGVRQLDERRRQSSGSAPGAGTLLVANHTSFLEVLYLSWKFGPVFAAVAPPQGKAQPLVGAEGLLGALRRAVAAPMRRPVEKPAPSLSALIDSAARRGAPVAIFPEIVRSNGEAVLEWAGGPALEGLEGSAAFKGVALVVFSYPGKGPAPVHPVGSLARQLFWNCFQPWRSTVVVQVLDQRSVPAAPFAAANVGSGGARRQSPAAWVAELRALVATVAGKRRVALGCEDALSFAEYWEALRRGDKDTATRIANARTKH